MWQRPFTSVLSKNKCSYNFDWVLCSIRKSLPISRMACLMFWLGCVSTRFKTRCWTSTAKTIHFVNISVAVVFHKFANYYAFLYFSLDEFPAMLKEKNVSRLGHFLSTVYAGKKVIAHRPKDLFG